VPWYKEIHFAGNNVFDWLYAALIIVVALVVGKTLYWLIGKTVKRMAARTRTQLDDILVDMLEEPIVLAVVVLGIWYGVSVLTMTDAAAKVVGNIIEAVLILNGAWLITRVFDSLIKEYLIPLAEKTESELDDLLVPIISKGIKVSVWTIALIMVVHNAGYNVFAILGGLGIGGLAFALAAQDTVGNFFGSIAIFLDKPFKVGDRIQVG